MSTSLLPVAVPAEVAAFAAEVGVSAYLPAVIEMTRRIFPDAPLRLYLEDDPEIPDRYLVLEVDLDSYPAQQCFSNQQNWSREIFQDCPAAHVHIFHLRMI
jgi:hypothetical protein